MNLSGWIWWLLQCNKFTNPNILQHSVTSSFLTIKPLKHQITWIISLSYFLLLIDCWENTSNKGTKKCDWLQFITFLELVFSSPWLWKRNKRRTRQLTRYLTNAVTLTVRAKIGWVGHFSFCFLLQHFTNIIKKETMIREIPFIKARKLSFFTLICRSFF